MNRRLTLEKSTKSSLSRYRTLSRPSNDPEALSGAFASILVSKTLGASGNRGLEEAVATRPLAHQVHDAAEWRRTVQRRCRTLDDFNPLETCEFVVGARDVGQCQSIEEDAVVGGVIAANGVRVIEG